MLAEVEERSRTKVLIGRDIDTTFFQKQEMIKKKNRKLETKKGKSGPNM